MSVLETRMKWPGLAQDLAVMSLPNSPIKSLTDLYTAYGVTEAELKHLLTVPEFQTMFRKEYEKMQELGPNAGAVYKFSSLSQALGEKLWRQAVLTDNMEARDMLRLFELMLKAAGFMSERKESQVNTQVNVGVHLPLPTGLNNPKLKHIEAAANG